MAGGPRGPVIPSNRFSVPPALPSYRTFDLAAILTLRPNNSTISGPVQVSTVDVDVNGIASSTLSGVTAGNLLVANLYSGAGAIISGPTNWVKAVAALNGNQAAEIWYLAGKDNNTGGTIAPGFVFSNNGRSFLSEWAGVDPINPLVTTATGTASSSLTCSSGTLSGAGAATDLTITAFRELLGASSAITFTPGANYTLLAGNPSPNINNHVVGDYRLNAPTGDAETETSNTSSAANGWAGCIARFQIASTTTGSFSKETLKAYAIALGFVTSIPRVTVKVMGVGLGFTVAWTGNKLATLYFQAVAGVLNFTTAIQKKTLRSMAIGLGFTSAFNKLTSRFISVGLGFTTTSTKLTTKVLSVGLNFTTTLLKLTSRAFAVGLNFTTTIQKLTSRAYAIALTFAGALQASRLKIWAMVASLGFATSSTISGPVQVSAVDTSAVGVCSPTLSGVGVGNLVVACIDTAGAKFTFPVGWILAVEGTGTNIRADIWYLPGNLNPGGTINPTFTSGASAGVRGFLSEWVGADPSAPLTATANSTASSSLTCASGTLAGNNATDLAITCFGEKVTSATSTFTPGANYTQLATFNHAGNATNHIVGDYRLNAPVGDSETQTSNLTSDANGWASAIATFRGRQRFIKLPLRTYAIALGFTTTFSKQASRAFGVSLNFTTSLFKLTVRPLAVALNFTIAMTKRTSRALTAATLGFITTMFKTANKAYAAALTFVVTFDKHKSFQVYLQALTASLTFVGSVTVSRLKKLTLSASMTATSSLSALRWYMGTFKDSSRGTFRAVSRAISNIITKGRFNK